MTPTDRDEMTRRELIQTGITTGFALAVSPALASAIKTPGNGLMADWVMIPTAGGATLPAYRAMPKGKGPYPAVLVIQEIFGVHEYIQDTCRRFAKAGYAAVAPQLYFREGDASKMPDFKQIIEKIVTKVPQMQVFADCDATITWLGTQKGIDATRVGMTGFCWGGNVVWMESWHHPQLKAGVAWYGKLTETWGPGDKKTPIEIAPQLTVPVLGLYGAKDEGIPLDSVEKMRAELKKGSSGSDIVVFPNAGHAFHADYRPSYEEKSAREGWQKMLAWFKAHGL